MRNSVDNITYTDKHETLVYFPYYVPSEIKVRILDFTKTMKLLKPSDYYMYHQV